ncbi:hypothetical protein D9756_000322 [Leucocoprinus leucothites]|uniref:Uncharacterized protein n=1 Tax=Leucocoprinus leucothites TaxID=201217 RepID=A0A8H5LNJ3_9AGAR|nr:hypothetical protein D9756_000322 [Leucoagaricus leucothites]
MRLLPFLTLAPLVSAQYFSEGWKPGQPEHNTQDAPAPAYTPGAEHPAASSAPTQSPTLSELFSINTLLTLSPVASLFERFGVNITERVALTKANFWDERISLITDDNFQELIVREPLTEEEERDRVWVAVISVTAAKQDGISKYLDQVFDLAFNETLHKNDLPNVRWGRIDYLDVTYLTTKWNVWQAPYLVIMTDRGRSLRFYRPHQLRLRDDALREFLLTEGWKRTPVWESPYAPGGDREWIMDVFATYLTRIYNIAILVPRWILLIITGGIGSILLNFLHRPSKKQPVPNTSTKRESSAILDTQSDSTTSNSTPAPVRQAQVKPEPIDKPAASTTATAIPPVAPRRTPRKGKGKKHQA